METDHQNLLWMEKSEAYIVIRWRVFLQSFRMFLRNIKGKENIVADWGSRMYALDNTNECVQSDTDITLKRDPELSSASAWRKDATLWSKKNVDEVKRTFYRTQDTVQNCSGVC